MRLALFSILLALLFGGTARAADLRISPGDGGADRDVIGAKIVLPGGRVVTEGLPVYRNGKPALVPWTEIHRIDLIPADWVPTVAITFRDGREELLDLERGWLLPAQGSDPGIDFGEIAQVAVKR